MDTTTQRQVNDILEKGYYIQGTTLGVGGWSKIPNWSAYKLFDFTNDTVITIYAKNNETAVRVFHKLFFLNDIEYKVVKVETTYITVEDSHCL